MEIKILIVDDEKEFLEALRRALAFKEIEADTVDNSAEALELIEENLYNIVLLDIVMPGMTGIELLKKIKEINPLCNVIMMTGADSLENMMSAIGAGACDYFVKPFEDTNELIKAIKDAMARIERW